MSARRPFPVWILFPLAAFLALAGLSYQMLGRDQEALPSALIDRPVPDFDLPSLREGAPNFATASLKGQGVKLVNIWASWCGPCRVEHPELMKLAGMGVTIDSINYKDKREGARAFLEELGDPFAQVGADVKGRAGIEWGVYGVPETFVITDAGEIAYKHVGPIQNSDLETKILPALRAAGWTPPEG
ncbi:MAG: DsbE family thiol:disulfide interchange protein [Pseudomonadota bacterium]|nr:DsbE family thiol:disulfide interchange protein [Pseudomonadota bacterium]